MKQFDEIELLFGDLLNASVPVLSDSELDEIRRYIDVGEYGLALESAVDIYSEERKIPSSDVVILIERLGEMMSMDLASIRYRLPKS